jgi:hypothetical protein
MEKMEDERKPEAAQRQAQKRSQKPNPTPTPTCMLTLTCGLWVDSDLEWLPVLTPMALALLSAI